MIDIERYRTDIEKACREFSLRSVGLVGSGARADFHDESDVDFIVAFEGDNELFDRFFGFKERLEMIFARPVDLIEERAVRNPYLRRTLQRDRISIYGA